LDVTFAWTKGINGANNNILEYYIQYRYNFSAQTAEFGDIGDVASHVRAMTDASRGDTLDFRVRAITQRGDNPYSDWSSLPITRNQTPRTPTSPSVPKTSYIPGETIRVSFSNNGDPDANLAGFEVMTDADETVVGTGGAGATYVDVGTAGWSQGIQRRFRVRAYDEFGIRSSFSAYTGTVTLNSAPNAPTISFPSEGSTVYNPKPRILLKAGTTNDGPKHVLCVDDGSEKTTAENGSLFSCGTNDALASEQQVVYTPPFGTDLSPSARMSDSYLYSQEVTRSFNKATFSPTDANLAVTGMKIKAVHITDLRTAINVLRAAYGLAAASWLPMTAGVTSIGNKTIITEMQTALQAVINVIKDWDSVNSYTFAVITWIDPGATGGGVDRVKLRQAIEQLRTMVSTI
jgi:hypothetical protein